MKKKKFKSEKQFYYIMSGTENFGDNLIMSKDFNTDKDHLLIVGYYSQIGKLIRKKLNK